MDPSQEPYDRLWAILAHPELMVSTGFANPLVDQALSLSTLPVASDAA